MTIVSTLFSHKKLVLALGLILSGILVGLYIIQLNHLTQLAYLIAHQEEQINQLKYENAALQAKTFDAVSLRDLEQLAQERQFEKVQQITYVRATTGPVAQQ